MRRDSSVAVSLASVWTDGVSRPVHLVCNVKSFSMDGERWFRSMERRVFRTIAAW
jgi:hypothetical protein